MGATPTTPTKKLDIEVVSQSPKTEEVSSSLAVPAKSSSSRMKPVVPGDDRLAQAIDPINSCAQIVQMHPRSSG